MMRGACAAAALNGCGQVVTVWNKYYEQDGGKDVFVRHVIPVLCRWRSSERRGESRSQSDIAVASVSQSLTVIIPYTDEYRNYRQWLELGATDKKRFFTLHVGDLLALGEHETEITGVSPFTETDVKKMLGSDCAVISAFADNTGRTGAAGGVRRGGHFKVGCYYDARTRF